ncbi:MAG TPA: CDP-alcohol phosphatidyltransferase family protein [Candidatus Altiarchaeales archaeon]|nr:CDP-alcohol phosphatidyltransferase family protein [Candidatus Altiarchaeales archaeon]
MIKSWGWVNNLSVKFGAFFSRLGLSPNFLTLMSLLFAIFGFFFIAFCNDIFLSLILFLIAGFLDMVDGAVARATGKVSSLGAFLDGILDRYVEFIIYLGIFIYLWRNSGLDNFSLSLIFLFLVFGAIMTPFSIAYGIHRKAITEEKLKNLKSLFERAERLISVYFAMILGLFETKLMLYVICLVAFLSNLTALQRIAYVIHKNEKNSDL